MDNTWVKLYRKIEENPHFRNPNYLAVWVWLLVKANHKERDELFGGKRITCKPGQFTTGRKQLSMISGVSPSTLERILTLMESEQQIGQQKSSVNRLITIVNWDEYQKSGQQNGQRVDSEWTASGQRVDTLQEVKKIRSKEKRVVSESEFLDSLRAICQGKGVDFDYESAEMDKWLEKHPDRRKTRRFMEGWVKRADPVVSTPGLQITKRATKLQGIPSNPNRIGLAEICPTNSQSSLVNQ